MLTLVGGYFPTNDVISACSLLGLQRFNFPSDLWTCSTILFSCLKLRKILGKLKGHAPGEINLQSKQDLICHVAKVKFATSTHSMADVIPFQRIYYSLRIKSFQNTKRNIYFTHNKENDIRNTVRVSMFQKLLAKKHLRLRDSRLSLVRPSGDLGLSTRKKKQEDLSILKPRF